MYKLCTVDEIYKNVERGGTVLWNFKYENPRIFEEYPIEKIISIGAVEVVEIHKNVGRGGFVYD